MRRKAEPNQKTIEHAGAWGGFRAHYLQFPEEDLSVAIFANRGFIKGLEQYPQPP